MNLIQNFRLWLGESRFWALMGMLIVTGLASLVLQFTSVENAIVSQTALLGAFLLGTILSAWMLSNADAGRQFSYPLLA